MKGRNSLYLRKLFIAILLIIICITSGVFATDITPGEGSTTEPTEPTVTSTLPYIEMKVKAIKVGESNQILIEMWGSNFTNFEGMEFVFTYNNEKLTPSNVSDNNIVENLDSYKYEKRPTQKGEKPTELELLEQAEFDQESTKMLSKAFSFETEYTDPLEIDLFRYLAPEGNNEAMQFTMSKKDKTTEISATDPVLLGKLSFRQTEGTTLDETELATSRIKVSCNDGAIEGEESYYIRDVQSENEGEKDCTEIVEFTYEKYGSISGTITTILPKTETDMYSTKNIATIKIYKKESVASIDWNLTLSAYVNARNTLPEPEYEYTTTETDNGKFLIENINFGEYVILVDKNLYADYIITDVILSSSNKDIKLDEVIGDIELIAGDMDKNGKMMAADRSKMVTAYNKKPKDNSYDLTDDGYLRAMDKSGFINVYDKYKNKVIKKVVSLVNN